MKVTGFSFIKNAVKYQFPVVESLKSILPLCDEVVVAVGNSEDNTKELVSAIDKKIKIIDTVWDESLQAGGKVLAAETDKAFTAIGSDSDWCIYIQGDEVMHQQDHRKIYEAMKRWKEEKGVDGLLFKYHHFYGSFDYVGTSSRWYRNEIRIIKNDKSIYSYKDAQGFRKGNNEKLSVKPIDAFIYHYGWVREPETMQAKYNNSLRFYIGEKASEADSIYRGGFDYSKIECLQKFTGTHPAVMKEWIEKMNWKFDHDLSYNHPKMKDRFKNLVEKITGKRPFDYRNYIVV